MAVEDSESVEVQIRKICPSGAIGYRVQVYEPTPETYPLKSRHGRDMYSIDSDAIEYPVGTPPGDHQVVFLDSSSKAIKVYKNPVITIEPTKKKKAAPSQSKRAAKVEEAEAEAGGDTDELDDEFKAAAAGADFDPSSDFAKRIQDYQLQRKRMKLAKEARYTGELAEMLSHGTSLQDETLRKIGMIDRVDAQHQSAQMTLTKAIADVYTAIAKPVVPPAPPAPVDWGSLIKFGMEGLNQIATTIVGKRNEHDRVLFAKEVAAEVVKSNLSANSSVASIAAGPDKPAEHVGGEPAKPSPDKPVDAASEKATAKRDSSPDKNDKADKNDKNDPGPPPVTEQASKPPVEKKNEFGGSFSRAWQSMRRAIAGLTDWDIVQLVTQPVLLVALIGALGSMAPPPVKLDHKSSIYLPAGPRK